MNSIIPGNCCHSTGSINNLRLLSPSVSAGFQQAARHFSVSDSMFRRMNHHLQGLVQRRDSAGGLASRTGEDSQRFLRFCLKYPVPVINCNKKLTTRACFSIMNLSSHPKVINSRCLRTQNVKIPFDSVFQGYYNDREGTGEAHFPRKVFLLRKRAPIMTRLPECS